jgi:L-lactate dehydrogenase
MRKVTVIGAGNVGATIAYTLAVEGFVNEVLLIDIREEKASGEAMDIAQGAPFYSGTRVYSGTYADAVDSDMVIITSGMGRKPGQTRLDLAQVNVNILSDIAPQITKYAPDAIYLIVSNPVDVLTYVFHKITNIPANRIIGSGTILDTSRVRSYLAKHFDISQQNIHTHVLGEHGDSSFIPWSQASVSTVDIDKYAELVKAHGVDVPPLDREAVEEYVRSSGSQIIARKGATYYAVAVATVHICKCIFGDNDTALTVSTMLGGEYGISDVCLSLLTVVGQEGVKFRIPSHLTDEEVAKLRHSADCLRQVIDQIKF